MPPAWSSFPPDMDAHPPDPPEILFETRWLRVCRRGKWDYVERAHGNGHAVVIVAATPDDRVLFVEQVRAAVGHRTIELPAGLVGDESANDTPEAAAVRELVEETGWKPARVEVLVEGPTTPGMSNERAAIVRATGLEQVGPGGGTEHEDITVHAVPRAEAAGWLMRKQAEGYSVDLKVWGGLWLLEHAPGDAPVD